MAPKKTQRTWCDPYIRGMLPIIGAIVGSILCDIHHSVTNYELDQDRWTCAKFSEGECLRFERKIQLNPTDKVMKNDGTSRSDKASP